MYLLFIIIVAFLHSVVENIEYDFANTRFSTWKASFWNPEISQYQAKKVLGIRIDAINVFNTLSFVIGTMAIVFAQLRLFQIHRSFMGLGWQIVLSIAVYIIIYNISTIHYVRNHTGGTTSPTTTEEKP